MSYENVRTEQDGELLIVTLSRLEKQNALTHQMRVDLMDCMRDTETDDSIKAIVITGDGDKSFSAGANIPELAKRTYETESGPRSDLRKQLPTAIENLAKPSVAAINGYCFGAGLELAMGCTVRIASDNARLAQPEITLGQIPGSGGTQRLYRLVGMGWALQLVLTGQRIDADTACRIGLVTEVHPQAELLDRAKDLARTLGAMAPLAFKAGRDAVLASAETDLQAGIALEKRLYAELAATEDYQEGLNAFAEKRQPDYKGK